MNKKFKIDMTAARIVSDPHHSGLVQWAWVNETLYMRRCTTRHVPEDWEKVDKVHATPARIAALNRIMNH